MGQDDSQGGDNEMLGIRFAASDMAQLSNTLIEMALNCGRRPNQTFMTNVSRGSDHLGDIVGRQKGQWPSAHHSVTLGPWAAVLRQVFRGTGQSEGGEPGAAQWAAFALGLSSREGCCPVLVTGQPCQWLGQC